MRGKALVVVAALAAVGWPAASFAEKVKTNQDTKVYSRAGEQAPVVLKITSGKTVTVLTHDGRWVKIRVSGRTGWVPRSKLDLPEGDEEVARNIRRRPFVDGRGTRRGFGGEAGPDDRVGADAVGEGDDQGSHVSRPGRDETEDAAERSGKKPRKPEKPEKPEKGEKPEKVAREKPEKPEKPTKASKPSKGEDDDVVSVDDDDTDPDNAPTVDASAPEADAPPPSRPMAHVAKATRVYAKPDADSDEAFTADAKTELFVGKTKGDWTKVSTDDGDAGYVLTAKLDIEGGNETSPGGRRRQIDGRARIGITLFKQSVATPGNIQKVPDNYSASSSSFTLALGGGVLYPYKDKFWYGGELNYDYNKAIPGISYGTSTTSFSYHVLDLVAVGGYDLKTANAMTVYARFGLHYDSFQVSGDVTDFVMNNPAKLPNQIIAAPIIGAGIGIAKLTPKLGLVARLDLLPTGSVSQTKNLEDGTDPSVKGVFLGGRLTYHYKPKIDLQFTYDLMYESISFGGMPPAGSQRGHMGTGPSSGSDFNNALAGGISYAF